MKSVSSVGVAADHALVLQAAQAAVAKDRLALFTDFQWFLFEAKDAVYFTAFSTRTYDKDSLSNLVAQMVALAPQLSHGFVGARPGQPFPQHLLDAITEVTMVDDFDGYPDKWLSHSQDIFARDDLPLFRVQAAVRRGGADAEGRTAIVQIRASHALLEGADSAMLTRSQSAARNAGGGLTGNIKVGPVARVLGFLKAQALGWSYIAAANLLAPAESEWGFKTLAIKRQRLRALASRLGVRQRSLYFALVTYALHGGEGGAPKSKRVVGAAYTLLGENSRNELEDNFLRVRALQAKFKVSDDFVAFVRMVDDQVGELETKDISRFMTLLGTIMKTLRGINKLWKGLPGKRFWRFSMGLDIVLTLVPPHRTYGPLADGLIEPVYCGAWHTAQNICTYCPGREYLTMNFSMEQRYIDKVDQIMPLIERLEAMNLQPAGRRVADGED